MQKNKTGQGKANLKLSGHRYYLIKSYQAYPIILGIFLVLLAPLAKADIFDYFSLTLTGVTQYDFRGFDLSGTDPAFQGSVDFKHDSGAYAQVWWSSSLDFGGCCDESWEVVYFGGYKNTFGDTGIGYDVGLVYFDFPGLDTDLDYLEFYAGLNYAFLDVKAWYTENFHSINESSFYIEGKTTFDIPYDMKLALHVGYTGGRALDDEFVQFTNAEQYVDYSAAISRAVGPFNLELKYIDTDIDGDLKVTSGPGSNDGRVIFSVSTTLPWKR